MADHTKPRIINFCEAAIAAFCNRCNRVIVVDVDSDLYRVCDFCDLSEEVYVCHLCQPISETIFDCKAGGGGCFHLFCKSHGNVEKRICEECQQE